MASICPDIQLLTVECARLFQDIPYFHSEVDIVGIVLISYEVAILCGEAPITVSCVDADDKILKGVIDEIEIGVIQYDQLLIELKIPDSSGIGVILFFEY